MTVSAAEQEKTGLGNYFIANYPPFSFWKPTRTSRTRSAALERAAAAGRAARAVPAHPVLPEAVQVLLLPRLHRQERQRHLGLPRRDHEGSRAAEQDRVRRRAAARLRLLRRRHAVVPQRDAARRADDAAARDHAVGRGPRSHVRVRAGHAPEAQTRNAPEASASRGSASASRTSSRRSCSTTAGRTSKTKSTARYGWARELGFPQINIDLIAGHGRRGLGQLEGVRREDDRARPGLRDDLPDGTAVQHRVLEGARAGEAARTTNAAAATPRWRSPTGRPSGRGRSTRSTSW